MRLLIGYDGSSYADAAIADLQRAGLPPDVEALVVTVGDAPLVAPFASHRIIEQTFVGERVRLIVEHANRQVSEALTEAKRFACSGASQLKSLHPSWQVQSEVAAGKPATELIRVAANWCADLIVVGTQGRSALGRLLLGSVSLEVARQAPCSVRIGRALTKTKGLDSRVLVGLDRSRAADRVLRHVLQRTWPAGTELRVVNVDDRVTAPVGVFRELFVDGLKVSAGILEGDPRDVLIAEANSWEAECIVFGSQLGGDRTEGFLDSGICAALTANTDCSLEVVR